MKKLLSIILAAAMLISLVPSVFAVVDEETGLNKLTYNFNCTELGLETTAFNSANLPGRKTTDNRTGDAWQILSWTTPYNLTGGTSYINENYMRYIAPIKPYGNGAVMFAITVDIPGTYKPTINYRTSNRGPYIEAYIFDSAIGNGEPGADETLFSKATAQSEKRLVSTSGETYIDSYSATETQLFRDFKEIEFDEAGTYYFAVVANGANASVTKNPIVLLESLTLTQTKLKEPVESEDESTSIVYGFDAESTENGSSSSSGVTMASGDYTKSVNGGYWEHIANNLKNTLIYGTFAKWTTKDGHNVSPESPAYLTLKINVDKAGTYTPSVNYQYRSRGGQMKVYLTKTASYATAYNSEAPLDNKYIETYHATSEEYKDHSFRNVTLAAGTYYLHFVIDGIDSAATDTAQEHIKNFTLTPVADAPSNDITYCVASNHPDDKMQIKTSARGNTISLSAEEKEGYTFRAWVRGSSDNGTWVSADPEYSFIAMTNTMLTAVYTKNSESGDDKVVEYYNENGAYIATKPTNEAAPTPEKLVGYEFDAWYVNDRTELNLESIAEALTRAVAKHTVEDTTYTVTYNDDNTDYKYNDEVTLTAPEAVCWYRDGKPVDYGTAYTFFVWDDTIVTTASGNNEPKVMLDKAKSSSRMIEYDEGNGDIIEAGIIFGDSASITVDSCSEKMISQKNSAHGQFTATSDYSAARGYIIYKNINGGLAIAYAD